MRHILCYDILKLEEALKSSGYSLVKLPTVYDMEEGPTEETETYYFAKPDVQKVTYHFCAFYTSIDIQLKNNKTVFASDVEFVGEKKDLPLNTNNYISPKLKRNGNLVEVSIELKEWLLSRKIKQTFLDEISTTIVVYESIVYSGVPTVIDVKDNIVSYGYTDAVLKEEEIRTVLDGIEDPRLRKQVECILHANIFKRVS